jgi:sigma-B regulation protein RsbU (phosphoserine phosphatase)
VLLERGEIDEAVDHLARSLRIKEAINDPQGVVETLLHLAVADRERADHGAATEKLGRALEIAQDLGARPYQARVRIALSEAHEAAGDLRGALEHYKAFNALKTAIASEAATARMRRLTTQLSLAELEKEAELNRLRADRLEHELELARRVQMGLLPSIAPAVYGIQISAICLPALQTGGDYFDFFPFDDGRLGVAVGDVTGKGLPAAIYMTLVKGILAASAVGDVTPADVLITANLLVHRMLPRGAFISMLFAIIDTDRRSIEYASAGHNPMLLCRSSDVTELCGGGLALGLTPNELFAPATRNRALELEPGDRLLIYTDGVVEAMNEEREEFGVDRLRRTISHASRLATTHALIDRLLHDLRAFTGTGRQHDDLTAVAIHVR